jgi:hypothetical protein
MLDLVHKERGGEIIDRPLMRSITQVRGPGGTRQQAALLCPGLWD